MGKTSRKHIHSNFNKLENQALKDLRQNDQIIIKEADKGQVIILMDKSYNKDNILEILSEGNAYEEIHRNVDKTALTKIRNLIEGCSANLTKKEGDYLTTFEYKTTQLYGLPKVLKLLAIKNAIINQNSEYIKLKAPVYLKFRPFVALLH